MIRNRSVMFDIGSTTPRAKLTHDSYKDISRGYHMLPYDTSFSLIEHFSIKMCMTRISTCRGFPNVSTSLQWRCRSWCRDGIIRKYHVGNGMLIDDFNVNSILNPCVAKVVL